MFNVIGKLKANKYPGHLLALWAGTLVPQAMAPYNHWYLAFLAPALLLLTIIEVSPNVALLRGFLFGLGEFGFGVNWVYHSIHTYGNAGVFLSGLITVLFIFLLSTIPLSKAFLFRKITNPTKSWNYLLVFPLLWVLLDWVRSWLFTGFPWLYLGYSQVNTLLGSYAPLISVYGVTGLVVLCSIMLYTILLNKNNSKKLVALVIIILVFTGGYILKSFPWGKPLGPKYKISLLQGNIPQEDKWQAKNQQKIIEKYIKLTNDAIDSDIVVWPEASMVLPLPYSQKIIDKLDEAGKKTNRAIVIGVLERTPDKKHYYNSLIVVGDGSKIYRKSHLVPFGEYIPFEGIVGSIFDLLGLPMTTVTPYEEEQPLLNIKKLKVLPEICYEITYPNDVINAGRDANVILTVSNDTWFGHTIGPAQHLQIAQMRAREAYLPVIRATNNGITALINERGQIYQQIPQFEEGILTGEVEGFVSNTPIEKIGITELMLGLLVLLIALLLVENSG